MVFTPPPALVPMLPEIPDLPICDFIFDEKYGRHPIATSRDPYICGLTGKSFSVREQKDRVQYLARALARELQWKVNDCTEFDKVAGIFALNTVRASFSPQSAPRKRRGGKRKRRNKVDAFPVVRSIS